MGIKEGKDALEPIGSVNSKVNRRMNAAVKHERYLCT
jgi:hypothetical protein